MRSLYLSGAVVVLLLAGSALGAAPARPAAGKKAPAAAAEPPVPAEWRTPAEISDFRTTSTYDDTLGFLQSVQAKVPEMAVRYIGNSAEGRPIPVVILSKEKIFSPEHEEGEALAPGVQRKPVVLIQNAIHAGEIDGTDACLLLLRDLALGRRRELLDAATLLIVPIYNIDGHERVSPYNRPNQNGPEEGMGFRTTSNGLDLNRDYMKLDSPESRALISLVNAWRPDLHVDNHVTDGVDHDWVLTYSWAEAPQAPAPVDAWLSAHMPAVLQATEKAGHRTGPYVDLKDRTDPTKGFSSWVGGARYSTGYFPLRNRPSVLVETHSYKPYRDRVLATRDFLVALLTEIGKDPGALSAAVDQAEAETVAKGKPDAPPSPLALSYSESEKADPLKLPHYETALKTSVVTGQPVLTYTRGKVHEIEVPWYHRSKVTGQVERPRGYLVLPGWPQIEARLRGHGIRVRRITTPIEVEVETLRLAAPQFAKAPYQGLTAVEAQVTRQKETRKLLDGTLWIPADQPDFELAAELLEPESPDSLFAWGLLSTLFEQKEYISPQVLEGIAQEKLKDPKLAAEWQAALQDPAFAKDANARYRWWYRHTPYYDETVGLLPVYRLMQPQQFVTRAWR
ncbi:MAG TPA: M14 family metallopeptidase [Thermoanaerobaculia bacterium]|nr:M14 family metallopeptidase [Thermoanaerobaculia bacterium]